MEKTGYNITQEENGLRKFGPPSGWIGPPPPKGSDIFIGKLPRDVFEDELVPLCEQFGKIYELRLMMNFNGENRGYAFITYTNNYDATKAIKHLDDFEIKPGRHIGACKAIDNCRLFVGGIPKDKTREEIMAEINKYTEGVSKVILYSNIMDKYKNRGFAFLEYETHRAAALARRKLLASKIKLFDHEIAVYWAQPEAHVEEETMKRLPGQMVPETLDGYACEGYPEREEEEPVEEIEWNVEETRTELDDSDDDTESDDEPSKIQVFFEEWKRFFCGPSYF